MNIPKQATAGTLESSDCLVTISPGDSLDISLESVSKKRFGAHLQALIESTLAEIEVTAGKIEIIDRGALDYCIKARIITAVKRSNAPC